MKRGSVLALGVAGYVSIVGSSVAVGQYQQQFKANGDPNIAIFDANRNDIIGDDGDCIVNAFAIGTTMRFSLTQSSSSGSIPLRICEPCETPWSSDSAAASSFGSSAIVTATGGLTPGVGEVDFTDACPSNSFRSIPVAATFTEGISATSTLSASEIDTVLHPELGVIRNGFFPFDVIGSGFLCNAGGRLAAQVTDKNGISLLVDVLENGNGFACAPIPLQRADTGQLVFIKGCFPVDNSHNTLLTLDGTSIAEISADGVPLCTLSNAPTASGLTLVMMAVSLLSVGAWLLGRRKYFGQSLPQP
jgi:hypothetical protein